MFIPDRIGDRRASGAPAPQRPDTAPARPAARAPWAASAPRGRELLAGVAVLWVLVAILVVVQAKPPPAHEGGAEALPKGTASAAPGLPSWSEVPLIRSVSDLPPDLVLPLAAGLAEARDRLDRCVALERRRGAPAAAGPSRPTGPAEVVLRLTARGDAVYVDGLEIASPGGAPEVLDCARRLLDGDTMAARAVVPGWRQRLAVALE
jgi:hypothetical protein